MLVLLLSGCGKDETHKPDDSFIVSMSTMATTTSPLKDDRERVRNTIRIMGADLRNVYRKPDPNQFTNILVFWRNESDKTMETVQMDLTLFYDKDEETSAYETFTITEDDVPPTQMGYFFYDRENGQGEWAPVLMDIQGNLTTWGAQLDGAEPQSIKGWDGHGKVDFDAYIERDGKNVKLSDEEKLEQSAMTAVGAFRHADGDTREFDHARVDAVTIQYSPTDKVVFDGKLAAYALW